MRKNYTTLGKKTILILTVLLFVATYTASAQMVEGTGIGLPGGDDNISDAPIDGFLSIGLIIGAAIGLRKKFKGLKN